MDDKIMVTKSSMPSLEEYVTEISELWDSHWLTNMGVKHQQLQQELTEYLDVDNVELLTNGHMALELTLQAMNLGGEVITTPFTFASTTHAIVRSGLTPVFCDIDPITYTINPEKIEELITNRTCAIVPVHVYGNVCNVEGIERIAHKYNLKVIYDAAHCFGVTYRNRGVASYGDASCLSFHATKVFNTVEGGAVCFSDKHLGNALYDLKNFGIHGPEEISAVGANAKMNEFCAAMGICNLRHIDQELQKRKKVIERYRSHLESVKGIQLNAIQDNVQSNYAYFPVVFWEREFGVDRDEIFSLLEKNRINARKYFYPLTSMFDCYRGGDYVGDTPVASQISQRILALPVYADLSMGDVDRICKIILNAGKPYGDRALL